jgi:hypothetical protein
MSENTNSSFDSGTQQSSFVQEIIQTPQKPDLSPNDILQEIFHEHKLGISFDSSGATKVKDLIRTAIQNDKALKEEFQSQGEAISQNKTILSLAVRKGIELLKSSDEARGTTNGLYDVITRPQQSNKYTKQDEGRLIELVKNYNNIEAEEVKELEQLMVRQQNSYASDGYKNYADNVTANFRNQIERFKRKSSHGGGMDMIRSSISPAVDHNPNTQIKALSPEHFGKIK